MRKQRCILRNDFSARIVQNINRFYALFSVHIENLSVVKQLVRRP